MDLRNLNRELVSTKARNKFNKAGDLSLPAAPLRLLVMCFNLTGKINNFSAVDLYAWMKKNQRMVTYPFIYQWLNYFLTKGWIELVKKSRYRISLDGRNVLLDLEKRVRLECWDR